MNMDLEKIANMKELLRAQMEVYEERIRILEKVPGEFPKVMIETYQEFITHTGRVLQAAHNTRR
ncbi:hypothetical protein [Stenotrophomonas phage vB_SmaS_BUCT548]|uniref:Uncharacterized protein n=1 Tax=Stenotrophomonas phage vB_SmaS_BUCT548 TaxID=2712941 RepID=A0A7D2HH88_9CAUD|nr:hypothetical protein PQD75_gp083 [Stenotrophomonas phage vB_SmaS_BUCT548]QIQ60789.1 hypothetical protein [Stenotrophomonas phage vB_SmaS_BUCT548]